VKIETTPILIARPNGRLGLPTKEECEAEGLDEFTTARLVAIRFEMLATGGDPDAIAVLPDDARADVGGAVDWAELEPYVEGSAVRYPVSRPSWSIWWDRLRLRRWDVPTTEMQTFHASGG
jgi:hypothetical protein